MIISVTEIETYHRCPRKWCLTSLNTLKLVSKVNINSALDLGTLVHKSLAYWLSNPNDDLEIIFNDLAMKKMWQFLEFYKEVNGFRASSLELDVLTRITQLGMGMMRNYQEHYKHPLPAKYEFVAPEQEIVVEIPGTEHPCRDCNASGTHIVAINNKLVKCPTCDGTGIAHHYLKVTLDGLVVDIADKLFILEHKTYGKRPDIYHLSRNHQFLGYISALHQIETPDNIGGLLYDGIWKRDELPKGKKLKDLFLRTVLLRSPAEVEQWWIHTARTAFEMEAQSRDFHHPSNYPVIPWNGCDNCGVQSICDSLNKKENVDALIRSNFTQREIEDSSLTYIIED